MASSRKDHYSPSRKESSSLRRRDTSIESRRWNGSKPESPSQKAICNSRISLSRSYDSSDGIRRIMQARSESPSWRRGAVSPFPSSFSRKDQESSRNQTILDDAAWMSERIRNLQKSGLLSYPSLSKLRDPSHVLSSVFMDNVECSEIPYVCSNSNTQSSIPSLNQKADACVDEPLSAFRLSEVTLSEEDLLADISSTRTPTPVDLRYGQTSEKTTDPFQFNFFSNSLTSENSDAAQHGLEGSSNDSPLINTIRSDLLQRLEALQYRAQLAAKSFHDDNEDTCDDSMNGNILHCNKTFLPENQNLTALCQYNYAISESINVHNVPQVNTGQKVLKDTASSASWITNPNEDFQAWPDRSDLLHSSKKPIRPEYYLPLSKEEEPNLKGRDTSFPVSKVTRRSKLRDKDLIELAINETSAISQFRTEDINSGRLLNNQTRPDEGRGYRRSLGSQRCSSNMRSKMSRTTTSYNGRPSPKCCSSADTASLQGSTCTNVLNVEQEDKSYGIHGSVTEQDGQIRNMTDCDEVSWISEENVEGFLRSCNLLVGDIDIPNASEENHKLNTSFTSSKLSSSIVHDKGSPKVRNDNMNLSYSVNEAILSGCLEKENNGCRDNTFRDLNTNLEGNLKRESLKFSNPDTDNETSTGHDLLQASCVAQADQKLQHVSSPKSDLVTCESGREKQQKSKDNTIMDQSQFGEVSSCTMMDCNGSDRLAVEQKTDAPERQQQMCNSEFSSPFYSENLCKMVDDRSMSVTVNMTSPEIYLSENHYSPPSNKKCKKVSNSQFLLRDSSHIGHKIFARITRSLSFEEKGKNELESGLKENTYNSHSEPRSTSFSHYWIPVGNNSQDVTELLGTVKSTSHKEDECSLSDHNLLECSQSFEIQDSGMTQNVKPKQVPISAGKFGLLGIDETDQTSTFASELIEIMLDNKVKTCKEQEQIQVDNLSEMTHAQLENSLTCEALEDSNIWGQLNGLITVKTCVVPETHSEWVDCKTITTEKDYRSQVPSQCNDPEAKSSTDRELTLVKDYASEVSTKCEHTNLILKEEMKQSVISNVSCSPDIHASPSGKSKIAARSLLSVYKNPLWHDEGNVDHETDHILEGEAFPDYTYADGNVVDLNLDNNQFNFSRRFKDNIWDTYEGMGAFIDQIPTSPLLDNSRMVNSEGDAIGSTHAGDLNSLHHLECMVSAELNNGGKEYLAVVNESELVNDGQMFKDLLTSELFGIDGNEKQSASGQAIVHRLLESKDVNVGNMVDSNNNGFSASSSTVIPSEGCSQLKEASPPDTICTAHAAREVDCLECYTTVQAIMSSHNELVVIKDQDVGSITKESRKKEPSFETRLMLSSRPKKDGLQSEELETTGEVMQINFANLQDVQKDAHCLNISDNVIKVNGSPNIVNVPSNDEEAGEEVKRVTFVYSDTTKHMPNNVGTASLLPIDLSTVSTLSFSPFGMELSLSEELKKKEQKQPVRLEKCQEDQSYLKTIGEKVEILEAEINKFKRENRKLRNMMKFMIRKMKQLQQGFRGKRRRAISKGCITCIYSFQAQRRK
ncbi:hypothetical protein KP509_23G076800 [Ceratopteris richardii]|nr:hypothetical protein KP509_23G076800 [Ceratopteris richardii]